MQQRTLLSDLLEASDAAGETAIEWNAQKKMRLLYYIPHADAPEQVQAVLNDVGDCPTPKTGRLGKTLKEWPNQLCARLATKKAINCHLGFVNIFIETGRRIARDPALSRGTASVTLLSAGGHHY